MAKETFGVPDHKLEASKVAMEDFVKTVLHNDYVGLVSEELENYREQIETPSTEPEELNFVRGQIDILKKMRRYFTEEMPMALADQQQSEDMENE